MEEFKFEKGVEKLENIIESLESGEISLDEALKRYEDGIKLVRLLTERLVEAEKRIEIVCKGLDQGLKTKPYDPDQANEKKPKRTKKASPDSEKENFL